MSEQIQAYLDGEIPGSELTPDDLEIARRMERHVELLRVETDAMSLTDLASPVMDRISTLQSPVPAHSPAEPGWTEFIRWFGRPVRFSVNFRPAYAVATAVLLFAIATQLWQDRPQTGLATADATTSATQSIFVRFELMAPEAREVQLAGSFTDWNPTVSLRRLSNGLWTTLVPLRPGVHDYSFRVDGEHWIVDPAAPRVADGFGGYNSQLSLILASN
jgi:Glycogen recognition site of AMP-activated protein kinase